MSLTATQYTEIKRWCGYGIGTILVLTLTASEEAVVINRFLPKITQLEDDLFTMRESLDTAKAAVWERNLNEFKERSLLFTRMRLELCHFINVSPGPGMTPARQGLEIVA